jgi:hypothetical protein
MTENEAKRIAFFHLNRRWRILAPVADAEVTFPVFDPCRAVPVIAIVEWPCYVNCRAVLATHVICDGDARF